MRGLKRGGLPSARHCRSSSPLSIATFHLLLIFFLQLGGDSSNSRNWSSNNLLSGHRSSDRSLITSPSFFLFFLRYVTVVEGTRRPSFSFVLSLRLLSSTRGYLTATCAYRYVIIQGVSDPMVQL